MSAWAFRVKGGYQGRWAEVGTSRFGGGGYVSLTVGAENGAAVSRSRITVEGARQLRRALSRAIRELAKKPGATP